MFVVCSLVMNLISWRLVLPVLLCAFALSVIYAAAALGTWLWLCGPSWLPR